MEKKHKIHFAIVYSLLFLVVGWLIFSHFSQPPSAQWIFNNNFRTVVELRAFNQDEPKVVAYGSAVAINNNGEFVTNAHIISYRVLAEDLVFDTLQIRFATSDNFISANLVRIDIDIDLALIQVDANNLRVNPARIRTSTLQEGETVYAIGNGQNYGISITSGMISQRELYVVADGRKIKAIQTSVNITGGNSGGALIDVRGMLIGITSFRLRDASGNTVFGISFALPISVVMRFLE